MGQTDLNVFAGLPSAQGYTALTDGAYYQATGAHFQEDLDPSTLAGDTWDQPQRLHPALAAGLLRHPAAVAAGPTVQPSRPFPGNIAVYNSVARPGGHFPRPHPGSDAGPGTSAGC